MHTPAPDNGASKLSTLPVQVAHVEVSLQVLGGALDGVLEALFGVVHVTLP
jgi:hypothetical protein